MQTFPHLSGEKGIEKGAKALFSIYNHPPAGDAYADEIRIGAKTYRQQCCRYVFARFCEYYT